MEVMTCTSRQSRAFSEYFCAKRRTRTRRRSGVAAREVAKKNSAAITRCN